MSRNAFGRVQRAQVRDPRSDSKRVSVERREPPRTDSPSVHPCSASGGASSFFLASALLLHGALRPRGAEDARCVQPTSATRTNCVHPHLARSRQPVATFAAWASPGDSGSERLDRGTGRFHDVRDRFGGSDVGHETSGSLPCGTCTRAWASSTHGDRRDRASDIPVASPLVLSSSERLRIREVPPTACRQAERAGRERGGRQDQHRRRFVKRGA